jgi:hypothetical protein
MHQIKNISFLFLLLMLFSCIKEYDPVIEGDVENKYVISGRITDTEGWQDVEVSLSAPIGSPAVKPLRGCSGWIDDDKGNSWMLDEWEPGKYRTWMRQIDLLPGTSYRVRIDIPGGENLESGFDKMPTGPSMDSVYYAIEDIPTTDPDLPMRVMQFYIDLNAEGGSYSRFYKWEVVETWEFHSAHAAEYFYDGKVNEIKPPDSSTYVCWTTGLVKNVFTVSTQSLAQNVYKKYPLQRIDGNTSRLSILYSILVRQLALSEPAYNYWEQLRINSNDQGGLYEKQPLAIKGNLVNRSNPAKDVLGYFYATTLQSKRYFYKDVPGIELGFYNYCSEEPLGKFGWKEIFPWEYPVYFYFNEVGALRLLNRECIDCQLRGGTLTKPDFWPY